MNPKELQEEILNFPKSSWDRGNGSINNPYILENKTFIGTGSNGYFLYDKTYHFIIRNCTFIDSGTAVDNAGLKLVAVQNGIITNNTFLSCQNGIYFAGQLSKQCKNNLVYDNKFVGNIKGILLTAQAKNINISQNRFSNNIDGVEVGGGCNDNYVINNTYSSDNTGVSIINAQNNLIQNNIIVGSSFSGIYLTYGGSSIVRDNTVRNNDIGILLDYTTLNMFDRNEFRNNDDGIWFQNLANGNIFYNNTFITNTRNAHESSPTSNSFSYNGYGNSWDDYQGYDCNNDGIGETPYVSGIVTDNFPLCSRLDTFDPIISITEPAMDSVYGAYSPSFTLTIQEYIIHSQWYTLDGETINVPFSGLAGTIDQTEWDKIGDGIVTITFYANDTANNIGQSEVTVRKDTIAPVITINEPNNAEEFDNPPIFDITVVEANLEEMWYTLDGGITNYTFVGLTGTINQSLWEDLAPGEYNLTFYVKDHAENIRFANVVISKKHQQTELQIPFGNFYLIITIVSVFSVLCIFRRKYKFLKNP
jgi:parallel beta-helix repeat protein